MSQVSVSSFQENHLILLAHKMLAQILSRSYIMINQGHSVSYTLFTFSLGTMEGFTMHNMPSNSPQYTFYILLLLEAFPLLI
jgi:hypothetical protein